jgi:hypothetical protein
MKIGKNQFSVQVKLIGTMMKAACISFSYSPFYNFVPECHRNKTYTGANT